MTTNTDRESSAVHGARRSVNELRLLRWLSASSVVLACACGNADFEADEQEPIATSEQGLSSSRIQVMSMNVRIPVDRGERSWDTRMPYLRDLIQRFDGNQGLHLIGLQELKSNSHEDLANALPQYWWYWVDRGDGEKIAIYVRTDQFAVLDWGFRDVSNGARDDDCGIFVDEDPKNRPIQYVKLQDRFSGRVTFFFNTHYPSKNSCERRGMSEILDAYIDSVKEPNSRVIVAGDFNDGYESDGRFNTSFSMFVDGSGLTPAYPEFHALNTSNGFATANGWRKDRRIGKKIDHILVSDPQNLTWANVDFSMFWPGGSREWCPVVTNGLCSSGVSVDHLRLYSDHFAVYAYLMP